MTLLLSLDISGLIVSHNISDSCATSGKVTVGFYKQTQFIYNIEDIGEAFQCIYDTFCLLITR